MNLSVKTHIGNDGRPYLLLVTTHGIYCLYFDEMLFVEGADNHTVFNMLHGPVTAGYNLGHFKPLMPKGFMHVHQSFFINLRYFFGYDSEEGMILLKGATDIKIPLGCTHEKEFFDWLYAL